MANLQSDELVPTTSVSDTRKHADLNAEQDQVQIFKQFFESSILTNLGDSNMLDWKTLPGTKRIILNYTLNALESGASIWEFAINRNNIVGLVQEDNTIIDNYQYRDYALNIEIELLGNPSVVGELFTFYTPYVLNAREETAPQGPLLDLRPVSFCQHMEMVTFKNEKRQWLIPLVKPFNFFSLRNNPQINDYQFGHMGLRALTPVRVRSTEAASCSIVIWASVLVKYAGSAFSSTTT